MVGSGKTTWTPNASGTGPGSSPACDATSVPENPSHQKQTVDALRELMPHADELPGTPEPPRADFTPHAASFSNTVARFARS